MKTREARRMHSTVSNWHELLPCAIMADQRHTCYWSFWQIFQWHSQYVYGLLIHVHCPTYKLAYFDKKGKFNISIVICAPCNYSNKIENAELTYIGYCRHQNGKYKKHVLPVCLHFVFTENSFPSQGHYGFHSFPVVDWFCLFI